MQASTQFRALGTTAVVAVSDRDELDRARIAVEETVAAFDRACSRFRGDSELSALNAAGGRPVEVSSLLLEAVAAAVRGAELTDGDVDPTVGQALIALGYDRDFAELAGPRRVSLAPVPGWRTIELDAAASTIRVPRGVALDLGATAKALAADHAAAAAHTACECGVLVSLGGDMAFAGEAPAEAGWQIRVTDDHRSDVTAPGQWIALKSGGLATSSVTTRSWRSDEGATVHHLIDPATGRSVGSTWRTVSVAAASCLDANIASTGAIVRGEGAVAWLSELKLPSRLVSTAGHATHVAGWPEEGDDLR